MTDKVQKIKTGIENSGVEDATAAVIEEDSTWIRNKKYWYLTSTILPGVPIVSAMIASSTGNGLWLWAMVVVLYAILPLLDHFSGLDAANPG